MLVNPMNRHVAARTRPTQRDFTEGEIGPVHVEDSADCPFCALEANAKLQRKQIWDTVLIESQNFMVVPTKGALVEGWLLVVPRHHFLALGALPGAVLPELRSLVQDVSSMLLRHFSATTFFEHGPSVRNTTLGCGVDHAHLHLVPLGSTMAADAVERLGVPEAWAEQTFWTDWPLADLHDAGKAYLVLGEPGGPVLVWDSPAENSQFFRRLVASSVGVPEGFDYRHFPFERNVRGTIRILRDDIDKIVRKDIASVRLPPVGALGR